MKSEKGRDFAKGTTVTEFSFQVKAIFFGKLRHMNILLKA